MVLYIPGMQHEQQEYTSNISMGGCALPCRDRLDPQPSKADCVTHGTCRVLRFLARPETIHARVRAHVRLEQNRRHKNTYFEVHIIHTSGRDSVAAAVACLLSVSLAVCGMAVQQASTHANKGVGFQAAAPSAPASSPLLVL